MARLTGKLITSFSALALDLQKIDDRIAKPAVKFQAVKKRYEGREAAERSKKGYESGSSNG